MRKCIVCDEEDIKWPVVDYATGFYFCDSCWNDVIRSGNGRKPNVSCWLRMIANVRESKMIDVLNVHYVSQKVKEKRTISY